MKRTTQTGLLQRRAGRLAVRFFAAALAVGLASEGFATAPKDSDKAGPPARHWYQIGKASWYGQQFNGRRTATGEKFDPNGLTCAHRTLPLGSWVRVTNLVNHRSAFLRVNDRGPVPESRIVDLSYAAARKLGISGLGEVKVERVGLNEVRQANLATATTHAPGLIEVASVTPAGIPLLPRSVASR